MQLQQNINQVSQQKQLQKKETVQMQLYLMYMYDDFNNVVGVANETQAVLEYFKDDREHPMVNIHLNRLILQANISNVIHMDQQNEADMNKLEETRKDLKQLYQKVMGNPDQYDERITNILKYYLKNLDPVMELHQIIPLPTQKAELNQKVIQKIVDGMNQIDDKVSKIYNGELYQKKSVEEIQAINEQRKEVVFNKLSLNFHKNKQDSKSSKNDIEKLHQDQTEDKKKLENLVHFASSNPEQLKNDDTSKIYPQKHQWKQDSKVHPENIENVRNESKSSCCIIC